MRSRGAVVEDGVVAPDQLLHDREDSVLALVRQLDLDRDPLAVEQYKRVGEVRLGSALLARQRALAYPFTLRGTRVDVQPHVGDRRDVGERSKMRSPGTEGQAGDAQSPGGGYHPARLADAQTAHFDQVILTQTRAQAPHRALVAAQHPDQLVGADRVLLADPAHYVEIAVAHADGWGLHAG